jgi:Predicted metal-dependent hydrolase with the TIM-barrel fold
VDLSKVVIGHAGDSNDLDYLTELADAGVLLGMDRFGLDLFNPGAERIKTIAALASRGYAASMVLAHDANCFIDYFGAAHDAARAAAAPNWHYEHITDDVLPALLASGVTQEQIEEMMVANPVRYFTPAKDWCLMTDHSELGGMFDMTGVVRGEDGIKRYEGLPPQPGADVPRGGRPGRRRGGRGGDRRRPAAELRLAGGTAPPGWRRPARPRRPARRPGGDPAGQRRRLGAGLPRRGAGRRDRGAGQHPLHRGGSELRGDRLRRGVRVQPGAALPDGDALVSTTPSRPARPRSSTPAAPPASPRAR